MSREKPIIFIIEDEDKMRDILRINLGERYGVRLFRDAESALEELRAVRPKLIVTDVRLPGMDGIEFMEEVRRTDESIPFIVFTGFGSIDHAVSVMKKGAFDYLTKPISIEDLERSVKRALSFLRVTESDYEPDYRFSVTADGQEIEFVTREYETLQMLRLAIKASRLDSPILISGETGTGKDLVARLVHERSGREGPFVQLNCASIPENLIEGELFGYRKGAFTGAVQDFAGRIAHSDGGTLFLDEIGELPLDVQAKLLNVLDIPEYYPIGSNEKRRVDLHLVTASNRNLRDMVEEGRFRSDLYYRIAVIPVTLPPLRARKVDIIPLVGYFMKKRGDQHIISPPAKLQLLQHLWPGNVRELRNTLERSLLMAKENGVVERIVFDGAVTGDGGERSFAWDDVPLSWQEFRKLKSTLLRGKKRDLEREFVEKLLITYGGNVSQCAREAGIDRRQLQDMIRELNVDSDAFRT